MSFAVAKKSDYWSVAYKEESNKTEVNKNKFSA